MSQIKITLPANLKELGNRISRSLEPDAGGYHVFDSLSNVVLDEFGNIITEATEVYAEIPTSERYVQNLLALADYNAMCDFVAADYAARWPDEVCPSLADCEEFIANAQITYGPTVMLYDELFAP